MPPSDSRGYITPDAFRVAPHLLGLPLASPSRRAVAILLDLLIVAILVHVGGGVLFGLAAGALFLKMATGRLGTSLPRPIRGALRVGGAVAFFVVALILWNGVGGDDEKTSGTRPAVAAASAVQGGTLATVVSAGQVASAFAALEKADSRGSARAELERAVAGMRAAGTDEDQIAATIQGLSTGSESRVVRQASREMLASLQRAQPGNVGRGPSPDSLARAWAGALASGDTAAAAALRPRLAATVAADTLSALEQRVSTLEKERSAARASRDKARAEVETLQKTGLLSMLARVADELGLGFGWTGLYFTGFLAFWRGQTPGKRLLGMRVVRLDGKPMTLWASFERFGGYAASIFTGLLGFIQILWDRNRQGMHDKIVETVVVRLIPGIEELTMGTSGGSSPVPTAGPLPDRRGVPPRP